MSEDKHQEKNKDKKPQESIEEFCKRLGIKYNTSRGGEQLGAYPGGNLLHKKPKKTSKG